MYYLITADGNHICKVKGLSDTSTLSFDDFKKLLIKDSNKLVQHIKWFRSIENANISFAAQIYMVTATANKRELIYDNDGKLITTKPYLISNDKKLSLSTQDTKGTIPTNQP